MKIAGVDPSLTRTAVATGDGTLCAVGVCGTEPAGHEAFDRIARYRGLAAETLRLVAGAKLVMLEGYSYGSAGRSIVTLGEYGGILRLMLMDNGCEVIEVPPTTLKQFAAESGGAKKPAFIGAVAKRWNVSFPGEDEYFAFALYRLGLVWTKRATAVTPQQLAALRSLRGETK